MMHDGPLSTLDRMMRNPSSAAFRGRLQFLLSELVHAMMDDDEYPMRELAQEKDCRLQLLYKATILSLLQKLADGQQWQEQFQGCLFRLTKPKRS